MAEEKISSLETSDAEDDEKLSATEGCAVEKTDENSEPPAEKKSVKRALAAHFTAPRVAYMAVFTALAFVVTFLEFPIFPAAPFLKLDFANVFFLIEGFMFGPVEAIVSILLKEVLCVAKSQSAGVGEIANVIMSTAYVIVPSVVYRYKKGRPIVAITLAVGCLLQVAAGLLANRYLLFPLYMGDGAAEYFSSLWQWVLLFNVIKSVSISVVVFLIYKPLSRFIKMTDEKFSLRKKKSARNK